jgi:hypothetical protein
VATAGWIDRSDDGATVRFAVTVPDPLAFEREYLATITGEQVDDVRPDPSLTISFDGDTCRVGPTEVAAGRHDAVFEGDGSTDAAAVLVAVDGAAGYRDLAVALGSPGDAVDLEDPVIRRLEPFAFVQALTPLEMPAGTIAAVCITGGASDAPLAWLAAPIDAG